jgi:hypothetical protein
MEKKSIITIEDLKEVRPFSEGISPDRINPSIAEAHYHDLRPILGEPMYYDLMSNFDNDNAQYEVYRTLINGEAYDSGGGVTVHYPGLRLMVVYFALARFYTSQPISVTKFGLQQKLPGDNVSQALDQKIIAGEISALKSMGIAHQNSTRQYLDFKSSLYPLYSKGDQSKVMHSTGIKFF